MYAKKNSYHGVNKQYDITATTPLGDRTGGTYPGKDGHIYPFSAESASRLRFIYRSKLTVFLQHRSYKAHLRIDACEHRQSAKDKPQCQSEQLPKP